MFFLDSAGLTQYCWRICYFYLILSNRKMRKIFMCLGFSALFAGTVGATEPKSLKLKARHADANHFVSTGSGSGTLFYRDQLSSPRVYGGPGFSTFTSYERHSPAKLIVIDFLGHMALTTDGSPEWGQNFALAFGIRSNFAWLFNIPIASKSWHLYAGPALQSYSMFRVNSAFGNSALQYDVSNNLGVRSRLEYGVPFRTKNTYSWWVFRIKKAEERRLRLGVEVDLPLVGLQSRPPFAGVLDGTGNVPAFDVISDFINNTQGAFIGRYFYLNTRLYAQYPLRNGNRLQFAYHWHGYQYNYQDQPVRTAGSSMIFSYMFRFDKNNDIR